MSLRPLVELKGLNFNPHVLIETISYREDGKARNIAQLMITVRPNGQMQYGTNAVYYCVFYMYAPLDSIYWSSLLCLISKIQIPCYALSNLSDMSSLYLFAKITSDICLNSSLSRMTRLLKKQLHGRFVYDQFNTLGFNSA